MFRPLTRSPFARHAGAAACIALTATCLSAQPALASANVEGLLQNVVDMLTGNTARLLAVLAVVVVGILWMFGLFDLRRAAIVVLGIVVVFGAAEIVNLITGGA
ncbi:Type IV secretion system protein virB2 precursor [compost metagenome]